MISVILIIFAALFDAQRDKIQYDPKRSWFPNVEWWTVRNFLEKKYNGSWLFDTVLSFANDGWHFCKTVSILCLLCAMIVYTPIFAFWDVIGLYAIYGVVFNLSYDLDF
jgi:hypothetical protein